MSLPPSSDLRAAAPPPHPSSARDARPIDSRLVDAGRHGGPQIETVNLPVTRASSLVFDTLADVDAAVAGAVAGTRHRANYATGGTPTTFALMDAVAELEAAPHAARAALYPSGLAAIAAALLAFLRAGDHVLISDSVYGPTRVFARDMLSRFGVEVEYYLPTIGAGIEALVRPNTRVIYLESPGSYTFEIQDVPAICAVARAHGIVTMIDNAWASPVFCRPFDLGVDLSILPLTKYWSGHADVLMGAVVIREDLWPTLHAGNRQLGQCVGGDDAWLILRGLRTAGVRMRAHEQAALRVAHWLKTRPEVARVLHPALPEHPQHDLWRRDFSGSSGLFSFELKPGVDDAALARLCDRRRRFRLAFSWGGFESLILPGRISALRTVAPWQGGQIIRLHIGLDDVDDLIADLAEGLAAMAAQP